MTREKPMDQTELFDLPADIVRHRSHGNPVGNAKSSHPRGHAIARAGDAADRASDDWTGRAARFLALYARGTANCQPFLVEAAVAIAPRELKPREPRAWGAALNRAKREGLLKHATNGDGTRRYAIGRTNASPKPMWTSA
jgi:hypothetical protein